MYVTYDVHFAIGMPKRRRRERRGGGRCGEGGVAGGRRGEESKLSTS